MKELGAFIPLYQDTARKRKETAGSKDVIVGNSLGSRIRASTASVRDS